MGLLLFHICLIGILLFRIKVYYISANKRVLLVQTELYGRYARELRNILPLDLGLWDYGRKFRL